MVNGEERSEIFECLLLLIFLILDLYYIFNVHHCIIMCDNRLFLVNCSFLTNSF